MGIDHRKSPWWLGQINPLVLLISQNNPSHNSSPPQKYPDFTATTKKISERKFPRIFCNSRLVLHACSVPTHVHDCKREACKICKISVHVFLCSTYKERNNFNVTILYMVIICYKQLITLWGIFYSYLEDERRILLLLKRALNSEVQGTLSTEWYLATSLSTFLSKCI